MFKINKTVKFVALLSVPMMLCSAVGCKDSKPTVNDASSEVYSKISSDGEIVVSSSTSTVNSESTESVSSVKTNTTSESQTSSKKGGLNLSGGVSTVKVKLANLDFVLYGAKPTIYWSGNTAGEKVNVTISDTNGKVVVQKKGLTGNSYTLESPLKSHTSYILKVTYTDSTGSEKLVGNMDTNGKEVLCVASSKASDGKNYKFDGSITLDVLNNYLDRGVTYNINTDAFNGSTFDEAARFLTSVGAKYVQRAAGRWYPTIATEKNFEATKEKIALLHKADPDIILEASIFETTTGGMNDIPIPDWVFKAFGQKPEKRNFDVSKTLYKNGYGGNHWGEGAHIPDITTLEHQMFVYHRACRYIDMGFESLHLGQVLMTGKSDPDNKVWAKVISMIREYAKTHARRHYVLINAHNNNFTAPDGKMLVDMIVAPSRVHAPAGSVKHAPSEGNPQKCIIEKGYWGSSIYQAGISGTSPSGWFANTYPYIVEFDNYEYPESGINDPNKLVWGRDEIGWYIAQPDSYKREFSSWMVDEIRRMDGKNGHVALVGFRGGNYYANNKSKYCPQGAGDEETIRLILAK